MLQYFTILMGVLMHNIKQRDQTVNPACFQSVAANWCSIRWILVTFQFTGHTTPIYCIIHRKLLLELLLRKCHLNGFIRYRHSLPREMQTVTFHQRSGPSDLQEIGQTCFCDSFVQYLKVLCLTFYAALFNFHTTSVKRCHFSSKFPKHIPVFHWSVKQVAPPLNSYYWLKTEVGISSHSNHLNCIVVEINLNVWLI